jgi:ATP-dependent DNA helicase DinG
LVPGVPDRAWRQVSVTAHECLGGQRCPQAASCFSELSRAKARESDIVVTNHAFLAIDAFEGRAMLPEHQVVIIDEAHELADRVTGVISDQLSAVSVSAAAGAAARQPSCRQHSMNWRVDAFPTCCLRHCTALWPRCGMPPAAL